VKISSVQRDKVTVIRIQDILDAASAEEATAYLTKEIEVGNVYLVIDLGGVTYLSSAGIRVVLGALKDARAAGGDVRLAGAEGNIKRVIEMAGFPRFMKTFDSADEAVASFSSS